MKHLKGSSSQRFHCLVFFFKHQKGGKQWGVVMWVKMLGAQKAAVPQFHAIPVRPTIVVLRSVKEKQENSGGAIQDSVFPRVFAFAVNVQTSAYHHNPTISTSALRWSLKIPQSQGAVVEENSAIFLGDKQKHIIFPWLVGCDRWWGLFFATFPRVPIPYPGAPGVW